MATIKAREALEFASLTNLLTYSVYKQKASVNGSVYVEVRELPSLKNNHPAVCQFALGLNGTSTFTSKDVGAMFYIEMAASHPSRVTHQARAMSATGSRTSSAARQTKNTGSSSPTKSEAETNKRVLGLKIGLGATSGAALAAMLGFWGFLIIRARRKQRRTHKKAKRKKSSQQKQESIAGGFVRKPELGTDGMLLELYTWASLKELSASPKVFELEDPNNIKELKTDMSIDDSKA